LVSEKLVEVFACPACEKRPPVKLDGDTIKCSSCGRRYPIRDGIPVMLVEEAELPNSDGGGGASENEMG